MTEFRWVSKALSGPWFVTHNLALLSAMQYGQASIDYENGKVITLKTFASIEERSTADGAARAKATVRPPR
jgi:hypothetical protein